MNPSPLSKLQRLKELERLLRGHEPPPAPWLPEPQQALINERNAIFSTIGLPPPELEENPSASAWVAAFVENFPILDPETVAVWFDGLATVAANVGREVGRAEGRSQNAEALGMPRLVATLELVRDGLKANQISAPRKLRSPDGTERALVERIVEDLASVGVTT
jgi:hypothetical protein